MLVPKGAVPTPAKTVIRKLSPAVQTDVSVVMLKPAPSVAIGIGGQNARVFIGRFGYGFNAQINTWRDPTVCIGDRVKCNGASIIADDADIVLGRDCMLSDQIVVQSHAQHGVIDLGSMRIINSGRHHVMVGEHVWIGRRATLMPNVSIGRGCIVATGAVVTHDIPALSLAAGVPAMVKRSNVSWTRAPDRIDEDAAAFLDDAGLHVGNDADQAAWR